MILSVLAALLLSAPNTPAPATSGPPTKIQRTELAAAQRTRDSLSAARWEARRAAQSERDAWQDEFERVRDSLEAIRADRAAMDAEALRVARDNAATSVVSTSDAASSDPLETYRRPLLDRARVLRERIAQSLPWDRERRLAKLDSLVEFLGTAGPEVGLLRLSDAWRTEWDFANGSETMDTLLPRPEGDALEGRVYRVGGIGAWYLSPTAGVAGILVRTPDEGWQWREDLTDSARMRLTVGLSAPGGLVPFDPGGPAPDGDGFFAGSGKSSGWGARIEKIFSFRDGPLHLVARWMARLVMVFLLGLGGAVVWISFRRHRILSRHEVDEGRYEARLMAAMADSKVGAELSAQCANTLTGHIVKAGLAARDLSPEALEQVLSAQESAEGRHLESGLGLLGTIGSNAPFIGLFGTVCGILDAFAALGQTGGGPQAVMTAIAEALVATAIGLLVAIPAIWLYNSLQLRLQEILARSRELRTLMVGASLEAAARGRKD